jgi:cytochrome c2
MTIKRSCPLLQGLCLLLSMSGCAKAPSVPVAGGDAQRGASAIARYGCTGCHAIPGVPGPDSNVGPPLDGIARRSYVGGVLANTPDNMVRWLRDPAGADPGTAMPDVGVTEADAKDIAAYLYTLD